MQLIKFLSATLLFLFTITHSNAQEFFIQTLRLDDAVVVEYNDQAHLTINHTHPTTGPSIHIEANTSLSQVYWALRIDLNGDNSYSPEDLIFISEQAVANPINTTVELTPEILQMIINSPYGLKTQILISDKYADLLSNKDYPNNTASINFHTGSPIKVKTSNASGNGSGNSCVASNANFAKIHIENISTETVEIKGIEIAPTLGGNPPAQGKFIPLTIAPLTTVDKNLHFLNNWEDFYQPGEWIYISFDVEYTTSSGSFIQEESQTWVVSTLCNNSYRLPSSESLTSKEEEPLLKVYPNPVDEAFQIALELKQASTVHTALYNNMGIKVKDLGTTLMEGTQQIDVSAQDLKPGIYHVVSIVNGMKHTQKIVKLQ